jgi:hypothetical protein
MNIVGHGLIEERLKHSQSESCPLVMEWVGCFRKLEFNEQLHLREIGLGVSVRNIIGRVDRDIRCEIVPLSVSVGMCINEYQFIHECRRHRYLLNVGKAQ